MIGVLAVSCNTLEPVGDELPQRNNIGIGPHGNAHLGCFGRVFLVRGIPECRRRQPAGRFDLLQQILLQAQCFLNGFQNRGIVKIGICDRDK